MEHKRQFLICKSEFVHSSFLCIKLAFKYSLYFHRDLEVISSSCKKNILIGLAFKSIDGSIKNDLDHINFDNFADYTSDWSGRWILIIGNRLCLDPSGMLGCYYTKHDESFAISSSLALLNELFNFKEVDDYKNIQHGKAMNWFPPPLTRYVEIKKLLIGEALNITEGTLYSLNKKENPFVNMRPHELHDALSLRLSNIINNISKVYGEEVYLPLTGGFDSRTLLAVLLNHQLKFSAFIFEHDNLSHADKSIPVKLSKKFNFSFTFIKRTSPLDKEKYNQYIQHSSGEAIDAGLLFYSHDQYESLAFKSKNDKKIILRGGVWEVGRKIFTTACIDVSLTEEEDIVDNFKQCFPIIAESPLHERSIRLWLKHTKKTSSNLGFKDRFYLEQRVSGWLSSLEQAADLTCFDRIHPANCQDIIDLLSLCSGHPQPEMMKVICPDLLKTPFNKKSPKEFLLKSFNYIYRKLK
jgi:hypothetical protein